MFFPSHCCYCLTSDIECNSFKTKKIGLNSSLSIKGIGLSGSDENTKNIDYSLTEIHCKECNLTYVIQWKKSDYEKMEAMVKNALDNMTYSEKNHLAKNISKIGLDVDELHQLCQFCTKLRTRSSKETIHHIFLKKDKMFIVILSKKKNKLKIIKCIIQRSVYE
ncbi:hypothetical protein MmiHf6_10540 [Methanimicrococcus hongohii]|uniref:Uncharacterized protein n=1 Tax=Methanimicrococcus hongohii TaxID=3028295 RepID=A0AA96UZU1_9EURY|nr:hypothetical protein [Methanimicrococcus sp. Hf6]WNY23739.1 hypothetical protein MmiHf6_10540 [Methanimicrococcus sp. Hf6]